jgi:hypothetical protein
MDEPQQGGRADVVVSAPAENLGCGRMPYTLERSTAPHHATTRRMPRSGQIIIAIATTATPQTIKYGDSQRAENPPRASRIGKLGIDFGGCRATQALAADSGRAYSRARPARAPAGREGLA